MTSDALHRNNTSAGQKLIVGIALLLGILTYYFIEIQSLKDSKKVIIHDLNAKIDQLIQDDKKLKEEFQQDRLKITSTSEEVEKKISSLTSETKEPISKIQSSLEGLASAIDNWKSKLDKLPADTASSLEALKTDLAKDVSALRDRLHSLDEIKDAMQKRIDTHELNVKQLTEMVAKAAAGKPAPGAAVPVTLAAADAPPAAAV